MKFWAGILLCCFVHFVRSSVLEETVEEDDFAWLTRSRKSLSVLQRPECEVSKLKSVSNFEPQKFIGDWYEVFRTATSMPAFSSGVWRFQSKKQTDTLDFLFSARLQSQTCQTPISGEVVASTMNPGTLIMSYDGLKSKIEEEYKILQTDYAHKAVLYACRHLLPSGHCHPEATFLMILTRHKSLSSYVLENLSAAAKDACIEPNSLLPQESLNSCNLDRLDSNQWKYTISITEDWPPCKRPSVCTLSCPPCCQEREDGCIKCICEDQTGRHEDDSNCEKSVTACAGKHCHLKEIRPGCNVCECPVIQAAPPAYAPAHLPNTLIYEVEDVRSCATSCRTKQENGKIMCDCSNKGTCQLVPDGVPFSCTEREERYYFDARTGTCHGFFGSCLRIANNFHTLKECISTCADVCELPLDNGMCPGSSENIPRFFFNRVREECTSFIYGGCGGNDNNFETRDLCVHKCPGKIPGVADPHLTINKICLEPAKKGTCDNGEDKKFLRYFYLPITKTCTSFFYSGCEGNDNRFETSEECENTCLGADHKLKNPQCADSKDCPCDLVQSENGCFTCPCTKDGANGLQAGFLILVTSSYVWLVTRWRH